ncbi:sodium-dependent nutrient amino acid transporter 1 isoform X2 [Ixodes scapularis]|uniref:sodium-dependent nutrient amino acid transporter 1 isoform X2 n=1 Tax=Ixodes scapularis TaxID=6945 RepID=UPI001A9CD922|nr:sodium-dependent nutrient amino acid transporter 1 isoform X2 [Ixodes scapularis]
MANFHPQLLICLGLTWALLFLCSTMGLKPTGKKSFLVGVVTLGLVIFLMVSTVWQEGAVYGLIYVLLPKWSSLLKITVWTRAVEQVFFTFGITSGPLLVYGSYNHFFANIHKVVLFVTMLSLGASLMYAVIVFGSLGTMSWNMNIPVGDIVHGGHSVIFVAMNKYSIHWTLSTVFFLLVIVTGTNSQAGLYLLHLVDTQVVSFMLIYIAAFELLAVMWIYGLDHLKLDIMLMHGELSAVKLEVAWCIILPVILAATVMTNLLTSCSSLRLGPIEYPVYACYIGWSLIMLGALQVPLWAVVSALKHPSKLEQCLVPCFYNEYNVNSYSASEPAPTQVNPHRFLQKYNSHLVGEN